MSKRHFGCFGIVAGVTAALFLSTPASAEIWSVHTRANNIQCTLGDEPGKTEIFCMMARITGKPALPKPDDCEREWGYAYFIADRGPVVMSCTAKPVLDTWPGNDKFNRDKEHDFGGVVCSARRAQLRCVNEDGHGFDLSRKSQKVF